MNPIKLIRKLGKALRGGAMFRDMFLGIFLGFAIGMVPGVNLTVVFLILLVLFLNATGALAFLSFVFGKILCLALAPVTFRIGYTMIHDMGLLGLVRSASDTPVVAMMDLHVYCLIGAIPLIIIIGGLMAWFVARSVVKTRAAIASAAGKSEKAQKVAGNWFIRFIMRIAFGKQKGKFADMAEAKSPLIRKGRVIAAVVLMALLTSAGMIFLDSLVKQGLEKSIAAANGAEVNITNADLSLRSGRLVIEGLQVTDAAKPTHNLFQAEKIVADVSVADLLARRFVIDLIECDAMRMDVERESPGKVYREKPEAKEEAPWVPGGLAGKLGKIPEYYEEIKKFNERLQKLRDYLKSDEAEASEPDTDAIAKRARALGYLKMSAKDYLAKKPTWVISHIKISHIELISTLPTFVVEGKNISSHPSLLLPEKMKLSAKPDDEALKEFLLKLAGQKGIKDELLDRIPFGKKDQKSDDKKKKPGLLDLLDK